MGASRRVLAGPLRSLVLLALLGSLGVVLHATDTGALIASIAWAGTVAFLHFRMERTGKASLHRTFYFGSLAVFFLLNMHTAPRGEEWLAPYCHLSLAGNVLHVGYNQLLSIFNNAWFKYGVLSVGIFWLLVVFVNGGAFCGWVCFFGGVDDSLSQVLKRRLFRVPGGTRVREFQLALLIFIAFISFAYMEPEFCLWLCPFKIKGDILNPNSAAVGLQTAAYISVGIVLLLALPVVTKQRTFCSTVCPFGAIPPLFRWMTPYRVTVDREKCERCENCVNACPSFAMEMGVKSARVTRYCTSCLRCIPVCPAGAISTTLFDRKRNGWLLPLVSMAFGGALAQFDVPGGVVAVVRLAGSMF